MADITLEKVDIIRERTGVSYGEAKKALEQCDGSLVDALIYIEENTPNKKTEIYTTADEFMQWMRELINKGNITRIKIKRDDKVLVDVPVNAGIAAGVIAVIWPPIMGLGILTAVIAKVTVEITKADGSVEVVNKIIKSKVDVAKEKFSDVTSNVKTKFENKTSNEGINSDPIYKYTVKFEDIENIDNNKND